VQTTLLGLAIAIIIALLAALVGPYFIDWNQFRPQFEAEATRILGAQVRVGGKLDARLLPAPSLQLRSVVVGGANDLGKVRADKLDVEFSLGALMRAQWRATELTINGMSLDLGLDPKGRIDWPASTGPFNLGSVAIDRLTLTGRVALHDAASRGTVELNDIAFSGDVRSLAGAIRGDGNFMLSSVRYPFRISSGQGPDGNGTRVHLNIDPGQRALAADLDGVLTFEARAPRFEGAVTLAVPAGQRGTADDVPPPPWRIAAKVKADTSAARLDAIEVSYGVEERALKLSGSGDIRFGASPLLHAALSARQLDADRFVAKDSVKDTIKDSKGNAAEPVRVLPALRTLLSGIPQTPIPTQIEFASEQIMLGGRPLQDIAADLAGDGKSWAIHRLEFRAPGTTRVSLNGATAQGASPDSFKAALNVESADPDTLLTWLQGRGDLASRSQKPLRLRGDVTVSPGGFAIDAMKAEIDGGAVDGRVAVSHRAGNSGSKVDAALKAERLDLDAATAFVRSLAGPQGEWPDEAQLSLDVGRAIYAGQEMRPLFAKVRYSPKEIVVDRLKIGQPDNVMLDGGGNFDRVNATGKLALDSTATSLGQLAGAVAPFAPSIAARLHAVGAEPGPARIKLTLDLLRSSKTTPDDRVAASATLDVDAPPLKGHIKMGASPSVAAIRSADLEALGRNEISVGARLSSEQGRALLALLGLDRAIAAGDGPAQFEGTATGAWRAPLRLKAKVWGAGLDADAEGSAEPWAPEAKASVNLRIRSADLGPLFEFRPSDTLAKDIRVFSRVSLAGNRLTFDDLDSIIAGSRLRGRVALTMGDEKNIEGEIGLDQLSLAPAFAVAIGAAGHDAAEPLGAGLTKGWRGSIAFQALRGLLPGGSELQPVSGMVKGDGQSLTFDALKGKIGGGEVTANVDARQSVNGIALNASVQLSSVDGAALRYRNLAMPRGRASMQMTLASQGRSASALTGALSGSGTVTLESAVIAGLDPRAFDVAIRASDAGQAKDDARLKQFVETALLAGTLSVASAQIPFNIRDGRIRIGATALDANGARAIVSGGYDIPADQADIRATLASASAGTATSRPEIQLFAEGTPDALNRTIDVTALSSWLAVRTIDRETRRLDAIERGEPPPPLPTPAPVAIPLPTESVPVPATSEANPGSPPLTDVPPPRRPLPKPRVVAPRPPLVPPVVNAPPPPPSVASQPQVAPLPPPIDVKPAPGVLKLRPRPPLSLTPQVANPPPQRPALQNSN
jgi:large subunit ribosomal protein L24